MSSADQTIERLSKLAERLDRLELVAVLCENQRLVNELAKLGLEALKEQPAPAAHQTTMVPHADVARRLNRTSKTILEWCRNGKIVGAEQATERKWLIPLSEVERLARQE